MELFTTVRLTVPPTHKWEVSSLFAITFDNAHGREDLWSVSSAVSYAAQWPDLEDPASNKSNIVMTTHPSQSGRWAGTRFQRLEVKLRLLNVENIFFSGHNKIWGNFSWKHPRGYGMKRLVREVLNSATQWINSCCEFALRNVQNNLGRVWGEEKFPPMFPCLWPTPTCSCRDNAPTKAEFASSCCTKFLMSLFSTVPSSAASDMACMRGNHSSRPLCWHNAVITVMEAHYHWRTQKIPEGGKFRHNRVTSQINFRTTIVGGPGEYPRENFAK